MTTLVIAEKPSVARDIAAVLGANQKRQNALEGNGYVVTWCIGHLVKLAEPEHQNPQWKRWDAAHLPMLPERFELTPVTRTKAQYKAVEAMLKDTRFKRVVNACDAGREGELIFGYVYERANAKLPVERLWIASLTRDAIEQGFAQLKPGKAFKPLLEAAKARSEADWLVGLNATRAATLATQAQNPNAKVQTLTIGRVQTPTLALLVQRHHAITNFVSTPYWEVEAKWAHPEGDFTGLAVAAKSTTAIRFEQEVEAKVYIARAQAAQGQVEVLQVQNQTKSPPQLFDLTSLQRLANQRLNFSAQQTLDIAQVLYEKHKLLTYPRTDSRYITPDLASTLPKRLEALSKFKPLEAQVARFQPDFEGISKRLVNAAKVTDHHAILPTEVDPISVQLLAHEEALYRMVCTRLLASLSEAALVEQAQVLIRLGEQGLFLSKGRRILRQGWMAIEQEMSQEEQGNTADALPPSLAQGHQLPCLGVNALSKRTKPSSKFNEASLLLAMERAEALIQDEDSPDEATRQVCGLGTPATRASIIETLLGRRYIERQGKVLEPTLLGLELIGRLERFEALISPKMTAQWEQGLEHIEQGRLEPSLFMAQVRQFSAQIVAYFAQEQHTSQALAGQDFETPCPKCKKQTLQLYDRQLTCSNCDFALYRTVAKRMLKPKELVALLTRPQTDTLKGFVGSKGKFETALKLEWEDGHPKISFAFEKTASLAPEPFEPCPMCQSSTMLDARKVSCSGCGFTLWREIAKRTLSERELGTLMTQKSVGPLKGFNSRENKPFEASLRLELPAQQGQKASVKFAF